MKWLNPVRENLPWKLKKSHSTSYNATHGRLHVYKDSGLSYAHTHRLAYAKNFISWAKPSYYTFIGVGQISIWLQLSGGSTQLRILIIFFIGSKGAPTFFSQFPGSGTALNFSSLIGFQWSPNFWWKLGYCRFQRESWIKTGLKWELKQFNTTILWNSTTGDIGHSNSWTGKIFDKIIVKFFKNKIGIFIQMSGLVKKGLKLNLELIELTKIPLL